jgi:hypothetical protein
VCVVYKNYLLSYCNNILLTGIYVLWQHSAWADLQGPHPTALFYSRLQAWC